VDGHFDKPIVGVASGYSTMTPCNAGIQPLVDRAVAALEQAGVKPQVFGFPTVTDGVGMGTEGMKYSLVSREVIADSIETAVNGQLMDGVLCVGGCDKNMPGSMMAMARINVPGMFVYAGTIKPGFWKGQKLTIISPFEAVGAFTAGKMSREDLEGIEKNACPSVGACGGQYTANTMSSSFEALGMSLLGSSQMASPDPEKADSAALSAKVLAEAVKNNLCPRAIITRKSIEHAIAIVMATGGSTNAALHYLAIQRAARGSRRAPGPRQAALSPGPSRDPEGQPRARGLRRQDHRPEEDVDHRPGAGVRLRERVHEGDHGQADQAGRRGGDPLRRPEGGAGHAGDARTDLGAHRPGPGRVGRPDHRWPLLRRHLGNGGR